MLFHHRSIYTSLGVISDLFGAESLSKQILSLFKPHGKKSIELSMKQEWCIAFGYTLNYERSLGPGFYGLNPLGNDVVKSYGVGNGDKCCM